MAISENELLLREARKVVEALGKTLAPLAEVVLHDLSQPKSSIVAIVNNLSGRNVGDGATNYGLARIINPDFPDVLQSYPNQFPDGRVVKSTSIGLRNSKGEYVGTVCLNVDISILSSITAILGQLASVEELTVGEQESFAPATRTTIRNELEQYAASHSTTPRALSVKLRREAVQMLAEKGLLNLKNAQGMVAELLGVARSTIYSYLKKQ